VNQAGRLAYSLKAAGVRAPGRSRAAGDGKEHGGVYLPSTLWNVLQKAREQAFTPAQLASPLARKPDDFRHAGISWRLNAGTPAPLVAEWAGHTVEVLLRIYAHCLDGDDERWFGRLEDALGDR
jgi:integrase